MSCGVNETKFHDMMNLMKKTMPDIAGLHVNASPTDGLITRSLQKLDLTKAMYNTILKTCHRIHADLEEELEGCKSMTVCGVCLHFSLVVHGVRVSRDKLASACDIGPQTLSKYIKSVHFDKDAYVLQPRYENV